MLCSGANRADVSDSFTIAAGAPPYGVVMGIRLTSAVFQIFANDLQRSLDFYRLLGLPVPDPDGPPHVAVELPGGNTLSFDTDETIAGMHPGWAPPAASGAGGPPACGGERSDPGSWTGSRLALAFGVDSPARVDALFEKVTAAGHAGTLQPYDAPWGQRYATVADPDGNWVDLFAPLEP
jgi:catechol 2,3-dioxygenase-like lactoylglutathione lyase family enzyme